MNEQRFKGKVAVVTGDNNGIGLGIAKAYSREGACVVITGRDEKMLQTAAEEIGPGTWRLARPASQQHQSGSDRKYLPIARAILQ